MLSLGLNLGLRASSKESSTPSPFQMLVGTSSNNVVFTIPCQNIGVFNAVIDWGDGSSSTVTSYNDANLSHTYVSDGNYTVSITGLFPNIFFNSTGTSRLYVKSVINLGSVGWLTLFSAFAGCTNLETFTAGQNNISAVTDLRYMFYDCTNLVTADLSTMNTSSVTLTNLMFYNCTSATTIDVSNINTSSVTDMNSMFYNCSSITDIIGVENFSISSINGAAKLSNFMRFVTLPTARYDQLLINWHTSPPATTGISTNFGNSKYTSPGPAAEARSGLITVYGWIIADGGVV